MFQPTTVVVDAHLEGVSTVEQLDTDGCCVRVPEGVGEGFATDQQELFVNGWIDRLLLAIDDDIEVHWFACPQLAADLRESPGETRQVLAAGAQVVDSGAALLHDMIGRVERFVQPVSERVIRGQLIGRALEAQCEPEEIL